MKIYKPLLGSLFAAALLVLGYTGLASAHSFRGGTNVTLDSSQVIQDSLFVAGNSVDVGSEVFGDVFCAGQNVTISGTVHGDVICAGQTVNVTGTVDGDVRLAGQSVTVGGNVKGNATIASQSATFSSTSKIDGDVTLASADGNLNGSVGRDVAASGETVVIAGGVGRNVSGDIDTLQLSNSANVGGNVAFTSNNEASKASGAVVGGTVTRSDVPKTDKETDMAAVLGFGVGWFIYWFLAMLALAMAVALFFPRLLHSTTDTAMPTPWKALLTGFIASIAVPVILVTLGLTLIGLPLAFVVGLLWLVVVILSGPVFGYYVGRLILQKSRQPLVIMLAGASLMLVLYFIPFLGFIAALVALWTGSGMLLLELFQRAPRPSYTLASSSSQSAATEKRKAKR